MNIIFDLDGTLIDSKLRLYRLFQDLAPASSLSYSDYWDLKQNKISNQTILSEKLGFESSEISCFLEEWMMLIEETEYLDLDECFPSIHEVLGGLRGDAKLYVCTARQYPQKATEQLKRLNLLPFFEKVLVTEQRLEKKELIAQEVKQKTSDDWMVGDTGSDVLCGKALGMKTCAVLSGFLNKTSLAGYKPDRLLESVADFPSMLADPRKSNYNK